MAGGRCRVKMMPAFLAVGLLSRVASYREGGATWRGPADPTHPADLRGGPFGVPDQLQHRPPGRVGQSAEGIVHRHQLSIYAIKEMCNLVVGIMAGAASSYQIRAFGAYRPLA
jgi:hypothetical protein